MGFIFTATRLPKKETAPWDTSANMLRAYSGSSSTLGGFILRRGFDVIQGCNPPDDIFLIALPFKLLGVKYIFDHHDANPGTLPVEVRQTRSLLSHPSLAGKLTYQVSDVVMATNGSYRDSLSQRGGLDPQNVFVVRNGPDLDTFRPVPPIPLSSTGRVSSSATWEP